MESVILTMSDGEPIMSEWTREELDAIIQDFTTQLCAARAQGWDRSKPEHFRAIVAALQLALEERRRTPGRETPRPGLPLEAARALPRAERSGRPLGTLWQSLAQRVAGLVRTRQAIGPSSG
jgi:hypothetical protein